MKTKHPSLAYSLTYDYIKHIALLCTGSILLIVTFQERLFVNPEWTGLIGVSLGAFLISVGCSILAQWGIIDITDDADKVLQEHEAFAGIFIVLTLIFFFAGLLNLFVFALKNLY
ncbi:MAG: hypothetical protein WBB48_13505 [Thermodesulfobacteriota bacterium]